METDTEVWDGTYVEYYNRAMVLLEHSDTHIDELFRELMFEMRGDGYVPIAGTEEERVIYIDNAGVVQKVEVLMQGKWYGPDAYKVKYITEDGVVTWQNTQKNKSSPSSKTLASKSLAAPALFTMDIAPSMTTETPTPS